MDFDKKIEEIRAKLVEVMRDLEELIVPLRKQELAKKLPVEKQRNLDMADAFQSIASILEDNFNMSYDKKP